MRECEIPTGWLGRNKRGGVTRDWDANSHLRSAPSILLGPFWESATLQWILFDLNNFSDWIEEMPIAEMMTIALMRPVLRSIVHEAR